MLWNAAIRTVRRTQKSKEIKIGAKRLGFQQTDSEIRVHKDLVLGLDSHRTTMIRKHNFSLFSQPLDGQQNSCHSMVGRSFFLLLDTTLHCRNNCLPDLAATLSLIHDTLELLLKVCHLLLEGATIVEIWHTIAATAAAASTARGTA